MEKFAGFEVPVQPNAKWIWMTESNEACRVPCYIHCACDKATDCFNCIYSHLNWKSRKRYYYDKFPPGDYCGLAVPIKPRREWKWMLNKKHPCELWPRCPEKCVCTSCVYSRNNASARESLYLQTFKKRKGKQRDSKGRFTSKVEDRTPDLPNVDKWDVPSYSLAASLPKVTITVKGDVDV